VHQQLLDKTIRNCDFAGTAWGMQRFSKLRHKRAIEVSQPRHNIRYGSA
jgi:hypothetical protein